MDGPRQKEMHLMAYRLMRTDEDGNDGLRVFVRTEQRTDCDWVIRDTLREARLMTRRPTEVSTAQQASMRSSGTGSAEARRPESNPVTAF